MFSMSKVKTSRKNNSFCSTRVKKEQEMMFMPHFLSSSGREFLLPLENSPSLIITSFSGAVSQDYSPGNSSPSVFRAQETQ